MKNTREKLEAILKKEAQNSKVIAVSGKMASGKNYICSQLEALGWTCIDADILVHKAIDQSKDIIYRKFKCQAEKLKINILKEDNTIDRRELGRLLFSNKELLKQQEEIVYPVITEMIKTFISQNEKCVINATVLYKTPEILALCELLLFVEAPLIKRFIRCKKRDRLPLLQILKRFYSQRRLFSEYKKSGLRIIKIKN